jgi:hypothetical protein
MPAEACKAIFIPRRRSPATGTLDIQATRIGYWAVQSQPPDGALQVDSLLRRGGPMDVLLHPGPRELAEP